MADTDNDSTTDETAAPAADSTEAGLEEALQREEQAPLAETFNVPETAEDEDAEDVEEPVAEPAPEPIAETRVEPPTDGEPGTDPEPELPRFAAPFSSPEPTAVVARPRRRATRPALSADPDSVEAPAPAAPAPAFISFVAPEADAPAPPRRRGRRPAESPEVEDVTDEA